MEGKGKTRSCQRCHVSLTSVPSTALLFRGSLLLLHLADSRIHRVPSVWHCNQHLVLVTRHRMDKKPKTCGKNCVGITKKRHLERHSGILLLLFQPMSQARLAAPRGHSFITSANHYPCPEIWTRLCEDYTAGME